MGVFQDISQFVESVSEQVTITFKNISDFLDLVQTFFVTAGFWISVLVYFLLLILLIFGPIFIIKYWNSIKEQYKKLVSNILSKNTE